MEITPSLLALQLVTGIALGAVYALLAIGPYVQKKMESEGVEFGIWHFREDDFFSEALPDISDTIPALIGERFRDRGFTGGLVDDFRVFGRALSLGQELR